MKSQNSVFQKSPYLWWQIPHNIRFYFKVIPRRVWDRATKGYCYKDLWDLRSFYEVLFTESITEFSDKTNGYPYELNTYEEWQEILTKLSQSFDRIHLLEEDSSYWNEETGEINKEILRQNDEEIEKRKNEAFDLMKRWFFHLWY